MLSQIHKLTHKLEPAVYLSITGFYAISYLSVKHGCPQATFWLFNAVVPWLDTLFSSNQPNLTPEEERKLASDLNFKFPIYLAVFVDWLFMFYLINSLSENQWGIFDVYSQDFIFQLLFVLSIGGTMASFNINVAHELLHKDNVIDKCLGTLTLCRNLYMHFAIEHVHGHHHNVATRDDPATARKGETVYAFWLRSIVGSYISAWNIEVKRTKMLYGVQKQYSLNNMMVQFNLSYILLITLIYLVNGWSGVLWFIGLAVNSILSLETINYVEHYGLIRKEIAPGIYEPVDIHHSWNAPHHVSNTLLFKLQRHSDHHENPYKPYQSLATFESSPCLPHGYPVCILLALFPQAWFRIMDQHLDDWRNKRYGTSQDTRMQVRGFLKKVGVFGTTSLLISLMQ